MAQNKNNTKLCTAQVACDGDNLTKAREAHGTCGKCSEALAKKNKTPKPPRGENTAIPKYIRDKE